MRNFFSFSAIGLLAAFSSIAQASNINSLQSLNTSEFRLLSEDLGASLSYKPLIPAEGLGITGIDLGFALTNTHLESSDIWQKAASGSAPPSGLSVPTARIHKGLSYNIDIGASFSSVPSTNIKVAGGEIRWAVVPGGTVTPAVAIRASISSMSGVDQLRLRTVGLDASISKGFAMLTPYAGLGMVQVTSKPSASTGLATENFALPKFFAGANLNLGLANVAIEADRTGRATSYGMKLGFRF